MTTRRRLCAAALGLALSVGLGLGLSGCAASGAARPTPSQLSYKRTFDAVIAAMVDQQMDIPTQDRRLGIVVGALNGDTVSASLQLDPEAIVHVDFSQQGDADPALLQRVIESYNARLSGSAHLLPRAAK